MKFIKTEIPEIILIEPTILTDERGNFSEVFRADLFEKHIGKIHFVQENQSFSYKNVFRGFHFQEAPFEQAKLIKCLFGKILDIIIDIRPNSPTFKKQFQVILSKENQKQLFIPRGFAHGFLALEDSIIHYKTDNYYNKESEKIIHFSEFDFKKINNLNFSDLILSEKDKNSLSLSNFNF